MKLKNQLVIKIVDNYLLVNWPIKYFIATAPFRHENKPINQSINLSV